MSPVTNLSHQEATQHTLFATKANKPDRIASDANGLLCVPVVTSIALLIIGALGFAGVLSGTALCGTIIGISVANIFCSGGCLTPLMIVTIVLASLGLTGALPFASVGLGTLITMAVPVGCGILCLTCAALARN